MSASAAAHVEADRRETVKVGRPLPEHDACQPDGSDKITEVTREPCETYDIVTWRRADAAGRLGAASLSPSFSGVQRPQLVSPEAADFVQMVLGREAGCLGMSLQTWIVGVKREGGVQQRGVEQHGDLLRQP